MVDSTAGEKTLPGSTARPSARYQAILVALLSLNFGIVFFDRNALNFLMPFVKPDLGLSNTQVGLAAAALSLTWAISGFAVGRLSDRTGKRKLIIVVATIAFSLCAFITGLAASFAMLLGARLLMGVAEGGILPISQSLTVAEVAPSRRGLATGVMQNFGSNLLGSFAAPVLLVAFASAFGWRHAFFLAGLPGLVSAFLVWRLVREPPAKAEGVNAPSDRLAISAAFAQRNILLCALIAILLVSYLVICWAFMPLFLTQVRGFAPNAMGWLMGALGLSATVGSFVVPGISDRIGRKPVMVVVPLMGVILPLGALYFNGSAFALAAIFFVGWALNGVFPLFMATIPSETVDPRHTATVLGLVMGTGEVLGGVLSPALAGLAADKAGLQAPLWIMLGLCILAGLLALGLEESAPRHRKSTTQSETIPLGGT